MNFKNRLYKICEDLNVHNNSRSCVFEKAVQERLDNALKSYVSEIEDSSEYLNNRDDIRVIQKIVKRKD